MIRCEKALTLSESHADQEDQGQEKDCSAHAWPKCEWECECKTECKV